MLELEIRCSWSDATEHLTDHWEAVRQALKSATAEALHVDKQQVYVTIVPFVASDLPTRFRIVCIHSVGITERDKREWKRTVGTAWGNVVKQVYQPNDVPYVLSGGVEVMMAEVFLPT